MSKSDRSSRLEAFEQWADTVPADRLVTVDTSALRAVMTLAEQRAVVEAQLVSAVGEARARGHSWSQIGVMLGVSKQAAQRKYGRCTPAA
jgi:hypothetical protein